MVNSTDPPFPSREVDYRERPDLYRLGKGERGVFHCEPYKSELLPLWKFRTPELAGESSEAIWRKFLGYLDAGDFAGAGADLARKYLQMGWTRARRYANHRGGRKYDPEMGEVLPRDEEQAESAAILNARLDATGAATRYRTFLANHSRSTEEKDQQERAEE